MVFRKRRIIERNIIEIEFDAVQSKTGFLALPAREATVVETLNGVLKRRIVFYP